MMAKDNDSYFDYDNLTAMLEKDNYSDDYNGSADFCEARQDEEWKAKVVQVTVFIIVFFVGVIGNGLVIATFARYRCLRLRCMTDVFLVYLALSDLLLLLTLPLQISEIVEGYWPLGNSLCKVNHGLYAISTFSGLLLLACISIDRFLLVVYAKVAQALRPCMRRYSMLSVLAVAVTSVILGLPELLYASVHSEGEGERQMCMNIVTDSPDVKKWARVAKIAGFCVPFIAMLVCYSAIGSVLMQGRGNCWRRQRTLRLIVALVVLFLLFQLPYTVVLIYRLFKDKYDNCKQWVAVNLADEITRSLAFIRCCINPLLYALVGVRFRNDVKRLLHEAGCMCACLAQWPVRSDNGSSVTPSSPAPTSFLPDAYVFPRITQDTIKESFPGQKFVF